MFKQILNNIKDNLTDNIKYETARFKEPKMYQEQLTSFEWYQYELEYAYKKNGNKNNSILSDPDYLQVVREDENEVDSNAVAIYAFNVKIGYIPAIDAPEVRNFIHARPRVRFYYYNDMYRAEIQIEHK